MRQSDLNDGGWNVTNLVDILEKLTIAFEEASIDKVVTTRQNNRESSH
jgi:hypothetical protein